MNPTNKNLAGFFNLSERTIANYKAIPKYQNTYEALKAYFVQSQKTKNDKISEIKQILEELEAQ